jgi:hypothetical protein
MLKLMKDVARYYLYCLVNDMPKAVLRIIVLTSLAVSLYWLMSLVS